MRLNASQDPKVTPSLSGVIRATLSALIVGVCVLTGSLCEAYDCAELRGMVKQIIRQHDRKTTDIYVFVQRKDLEEARRCIDITRVLYQVSIRQWTIDAK